MPTWPLSPAANLGAELSLHWVMGLGVTAQFVHPGEGTHAVGPGGGCGARVSFPMSRLPRNPPHTLFCCTPALPIANW